MQRWDSWDIVALQVFGALTVLCVLWMAVERLRTRKRVIPTVYPTAHQDAIDALTVKRYQAAISRSAKAQRAERALSQWHRDPRSDGRTCQVIPMRRTRHVR